MSIIRGTGIDSTVMLYLKGDGEDASTKFYDSSQSHKTSTTFGDAQISTTTYKFGNSAMKFNSGRIEYSNSSDFDLSTGEFCISLWIKTTHATTCRVLAKYGGNPSNGYSLALISNGYLYLYCFNNGTTDIVTMTSTVNDNDGHYVVFQRESTGVIKGYLDGTLIVTKTIGMGNYEGTLDIGASNTGTYPFVGYLDDVIIQKSLVDGTFVPTRPRG